MERELSLITQQEFMRVSGSMTRGMEWVLRDSAMATFTRENTAEARSKDRASTNGAQERSMKDSGRMAIRRAMEYGMVYLETAT